MYDTTGTDSRFDQDYREAWEYKKSSKTFGSRNRAFSTVKYGGSVLSSVKNLGPCMASISQWARETQGEIQDSASWRRWYIDNVRPMEHIEELATAWADSQPNLTWQDAKTEIMLHAVWETFFGWTQEVDVATYLTHHIGEHYLIEAASQELDESFGIDISLTDRETDVVTHGVQVKSQSWFGARSAGRALGWYDQQMFKRFERAERELQIRVGIISGIVSQEPSRWVAPIYFRDLEH